MSCGLGLVEQRVLDELTKAAAPLRAYRIIEQVSPPWPTQSDKVCVRRALYSLACKGLAERAAEACALAVRVLDRLAAEVTRLAPAPERCELAGRLRALAKALGQVAWGAGPRDDSGLAQRQKGQISLAVLPLCFPDKPKGLTVAS